jgi:hypothetical protein
MQLIKSPYMKKWLFILFLISGTGFAQMMETKDSSIVLIQPNHRDDMIKLTDTDFSKLRTIIHKDPAFKVEKFSIHMIVKGEYHIFNNLTRINNNIHKIIWDGKADDVYFESVKVVGPDKKITCNFHLKIQNTH